VTPTEEFLALFEGNPAASYVFDPNRKGQKYVALDHGVTLDDIERHLRGEYPSVLSIPILPSGLVHFACGDCDRHGEDDPPIDHVEVAKRITELNLPLIVTKSKSPKSAHLWLFLREKDGFSAVQSQRLMTKYIFLLEITGDVEVFPKQVELKTDPITHELQKGNGVNLPYFSEERIAFGRDGELLSLEQFLALARERASYGVKLAERDLDVAEIRLGPYDPDTTKAMPFTVIRSIHEQNLKALIASNTSGHWDISLNECVYWAGRAFSGGALEGTEQGIKATIRTAAAPRKPADERIVDDKLTRSWEQGAAKPLNVFDPERGHTEALKMTGTLLSDPTAEKPPLKTLADVLAYLEPEEFAEKKKGLAKRLQVTAKDLDAAVVSARRRAKVDQTKIPPEVMTITDLENVIVDLLDMDPKEWMKKAAEDAIWGFIEAHAKVFCCDGQGYFLLADGNGKPIDVGTDSPAFNSFLIDVGVHTGSPTRNRIGLFIESMCDIKGLHTSTRLGFYFDRKTFAAYAASQLGKMIRITKSGMEEMNNGENGVLFIYPPNWVPLLTKPLQEIGSAEEDATFPENALFPDDFLAKHLFSGTNFETLGMTERQVRILVISYILFLMAPEIVSERAMLQTLGPSSSGKTYILELIGFILVGPGFAGRPLPVDITEFETQLINHYLIVYDNITTVPSTIKDRFCQAVTGIEIVRRVLFTDKKELREKSKATIMLSAIKSPLPELEHQNRTITVSFAERPVGTFVAKEELLAVVAQNRDDVILNFMRRLTLVLEALDAERDYVPTVSVRLASIGTFILRVAKHEGWLSEAEKLLNDWSVEQTGYSMQDDDVSTAIIRWMGHKNKEGVYDWVPGVELTASDLNEYLCNSMGCGTEKTYARRRDLTWKGKSLNLANVIARNLQIYVKRYGLIRAKSTIRTSRGGNMYSFMPSDKLLEEIRAEAARDEANRPPEEKEHTQKDIPF